LNIYGGYPFGDEKESHDRLKPPANSMHSSDGKDISSCDKNKYSDNGLQRAE